jgi:pimeloyl-ACP methyl ester carboxylesterase
MGEKARSSLISALPAAKVVIFKGLGHNPFWEKPQEVGAEINAFLAAP